MYFCKTSKQFFKRYANVYASGKTKIKIKTVEKFSVPIFKKQLANKNEFSNKNAVELHANAMNWLFETHQTNENMLRNKIISSIPEKIKTNRILVTSCGEGRDLPYLAKKFKKSIFYVQDVAFEMLDFAIRKNKNLLKKSQLNFWCGDACDLPFKDESFDLVYHFGGLNLFKKISFGVEEMYRVLKFGGACVFGDEGIAPFMYNSEISKALIKNNSLYNSQPPIRYLSPNISNFKLEYILNNCFYLASFIKVKNLKINLKIEHKGKRGGSIYKRYFGELEGIDPILKAKLYKYAEKNGVSRVAFLEGLIKAKLENDEIY
jgi:ubiquinone/menaquinone biosynthesis C-methylase UbiE